MTRLEYLKSLESNLKGRLSRDEINEIMRDYGEYFTEGERQGKSDWEMFLTLGDPRDTAQQIVAESGDSKGFAGAAHYAAETARSAAQNVGSAVKGAGVSGSKIALIVVLVLLSPVILGAAVTALGILFGLFGGLFGLLVGSGALSLSGLALLVCSCMVVTALPPTAAALCVIVSVGVIAGGLLGVCLILMLVRLLWRLCVRLFQWCRRQLPGGTPPRPAPPRPGPPPEPRPEAQPEPQPEPQAQPEPSPAPPADGPAVEDQYPRGGDFHA